MDELTITIGTPAEGISFTILHRTHPTAHDYWDGNWLSVIVKYSLGRFAGSIPCDIRTEELKAFRSQLLPLYDALVGTAEFATMEGCVGIKLAGNRLGHIECTGLLMDEPGIGNRLSFKFRMDQSYLPSLLQELESANAKFPVVGAT